MDERELDDLEISIEKADGSDVTATDVLRAIAEAKPHACIGCAMEGCRAMGLWMPGDPTSRAELDALQ
jgi:hypothetical protein